MSDWQQYLDAGWKLCELRPGTKAPRVEGWQKLGAPFSVTTISAGLVHEHSGTCALDIDNMASAELWLAERDIDIVALLRAEDRVEIIGNPKNHGKLIYRLAAPMRSKKVIEAKKNILDFRCIGNQDVLPPSMHPDTGVPYAWHYGDAALGHWSQLPQLPAALEALWRSMLTPATTTQAEPASGAQTVSVEDLVAWLASKDPDTDREAWIAVGMRIHQATNGQGFYIWDNWSRKGEKYKGATDLQAPWRSFHVGGGLGVGAILAEKVAAPSDFPIEEVSEFAPSAGPADTSIAGVTERLLSRLVYITAQDRYYFIKNEETPIRNLDRHGDIGLPRSGVNAMFGPHMPRIISPKGATSKRKPIDYLENDMATKFMVGNIGFHPGAGRLYTDSDDIDYLNRYINKPVTPLAPIHDELDIWERLLARIADTDYRRWLLQFYAFILKNPGIKVTSAPFLYSRRTGTGKTTLMQIVPRLLYGTRYVNVATNDLLQARFTGYLADTWFVVLDELKANQGKLERISLANKMKPWITDPQLSIERKGLDVYQVPNRLQITATSNFDDALNVDNEDRRWGICEMGGKRMSDEEATNLYAFLLGTRARGVMRWIFDRVNLVGFDPNAKPPDTRGHLTMVRNSLGTWESKLIEAAASGTAPFDRDMLLASEARNLLLGHNAPHERQVSAMLREHPFNAEMVRVDNARLLCWRNAQIWQSRPQGEIKHHMETGARPHKGLKWSTEVPLAIRLMAGDDADSDPNSDLLGDVNVES